MAGPSAQDERPLVGIKVLELGSLIAGSYAGTLLAQFGAEVIKIEPSGGKVSGAMIVRMEGAICTTL